MLGLTHKEVVAFTGVALHCFHAISGHAEVGQRPTAHGETMFSVTSHQTLTAFQHTTNMFCMASRQHVLAFPCSLCAELQVTPRLWTGH